MAIDPRTDAILQRVLRQQPKRRHVDDARAADRKMQMRWLTRRQKAAMRRPR
jgi:hypothetical protein